MKTVNITLPKEEYAVIEFSQNAHVGMATINAALKNFAHREIFPWHLSLMIIYSDKTDEQMPSKAEHELLTRFEQSLGEALQHNGNALFLASITQNGYRELIWRVYQPEIANDYLHNLIDEEMHPRPFDFSIDYDQNWEKTRWHFDMLAKNPDYAMPEKA